VGVIVTPQWVRRGRVYLAVGAEAIVFEVDGWPMDVIVTGYIDLSGLSEGEVATISEYIDVGVGVPRRYGYMTLAGTLLEPVYRILEKAIPAGTRWRLTAKLEQGEPKQAPYMVIIKRTESFDLSQLFENLYVYNLTGVIKLNTPAVMENWCPGEWTQDMCWEFTKTWDYVYWVDDVAPPGRGDQDYEDVVIKVRLLRGRMLVDIWHGEHVQANHVYWRGELLVRIPPRSAPKYQLEHVGTWELPYP